MSESGAESVAAPLARQPSRHGAPWARDEVERLVDEIQQGLTLSELAGRHQRTPAGITGAVMRLIPSALRPDSHGRSVGLLAQYLREHNDADKQQLINDFRPTRSPPARSRPAESLRGPVIWPMAELTATASAEIDQPQDANAPLSPSASTEVVVKPFEECLGTTNVGMLVAVAITNLPKSRDNEVLEMRLGTDGQPLTLAEIGKKYGLSRERVRQIQERALRKLARHARDASTPGHVLKNLLEPLRHEDKALAIWLLEAASSGFEISPRTAAKFILHTAGYTKAKTAEVAALLPGIERPRKARSADGAHARVAKPAKSNVSKWLEHSEWPTVVAQPPPAVQLSAHRVVNESDLTGNYYSHKLGRTVHYESHLELEVLTALEHSERIAYYQEQPAQISYVFKGRKRMYFPDVFAATTDGRGLLIEVKPTDNMALSINRVKADAGRAWAHARGWGWLVVNNRYTFREIERHIIPDGNWALLESELKIRGTLTWRDLLRLRSQQRLTRLDFTAYIVQSRAQFDRRYRVTACDAPFFESTNNHDETLLPCPLQ
jgi:hypothetical protein